MTDYRLLSDMRLFLESPRLRSSSLVTSVRVLVRRNNLVDRPKAKTILFCRDGRPAERLWRASDLHKVLSR